MEKKKGVLIKVFTTKIDEKFDAILLFYRDEFGKKQTKFYNRAEVPFYIIKDKESKDAENPPMFIEKEKVEKNITYSDNLYREIAMKTGTMQYFDEILYRNGEHHYNMKNIFKHNYVYDSDMDIADRYIKYFHDEFEPDKNYKCINVISI